jgi:hypothetical protein
MIYHQVESSITFYEAWREGGGGGGRGKKEIERKRARKRK